MLDKIEINEEQLLSFNEINRIRILRAIVEGKIKYIGNYQKCRIKEVQKHANR